MSALFVVVEGLDGSGKSTLSKALANAIGAEWTTTPCPELRHLRPNILAALHQDPLAVELFYAATVRAASAQAEALLTSGRSVIIDRYWLSTVVYARERARHLALDEVAATLRPADITLFVDTPLDVRRARLGSRGMSDADRETLDPERDARLRAGHLAAADLPVVGRLERPEGAQTARAVLDQALAAICRPAPRGPESVPK